MTPFRDTGHLTRQQINYNIKLSSVRSVIERAYGFLKNKFRRLKYLDVQSLQLGCDMVAAACMLHNFLILRREIICDEIEVRDYADDNANEINDEEILVPAAIKRNNIVDLLM